jgi:putative DNA methylase
MTWDFAEGNPLSASSDTWSPSIEWVARSIDFLPATLNGICVQSDAHNQYVSNNHIISTDTRYYDNIHYADLSDFFFRLVAPVA